MEWEHILTLLAGFGMVAATGLLVWLPRRDPDRKAPRLTGPAILLSLEAEYRHGWYYTGTFALSDGEQLRLQMLRYRYETLKEGQQGLLTWQGTRLLDFEPDSL